MKKEEYEDYEQLAPEQKGPIKKRKKVFSCHLCPKTYPTNLGLKNHTVVIHTHEYRFYCEFCNKGFYLESLKRKHLKMHREKKEHSGKKPIRTRKRTKVRKVKTVFPCNLCDKKYVNNLDLKNHVVLIHTHEYRFYCEVCNKGFYLDSLKRAHQRRHQKTQFQCELCGKNFALESSLKTHIKNIHEGKRYPCEICGKVIAGRSSYYHHKRVKHKEDIFKYSCGKCGKRYIYKSEVAKHLKITRCGRIDDTTLAPCTVKGCPKECTSIYSLRYHVSTHQRKKPTCPVCLKEFAHPAGLKVHKRIHDQERRMFSCDICNIKVTSSISLKYHLRTHTGEDSFICDACGKAFSTGTRLRQHSLVHVEEKKNVCRVCQKAFRYRGNLKAHFLKIHPSEVF